MRPAPAMLAFALPLALTACALDDRTLLRIDPGTASVAPLRNEAGADAARTVDSDCPDLDQDGISDCEETLVSNSAFDSDDSGWSAEQNVDQAWSRVDAQRRSESGSLSIESTLVADLAGLTIAGSNQCLVLTDASSYDMYAEIFIPGGQQADGTAGLDASYYASLDCSGQVIEERGSDTNGPADAWQLVRLETPAPSGANSISLRLMAVKEFAAEPFSVRFDNILVKALPN